MTKHLIPDRALDDRLAFVGTSGSGKTYTAKGCVERILDKGHRVVIVDPLDVWWGLRLDLTGKKAAYPVRILGGRHGDMSFTEHSGALIGEAIATTTESCIVSPRSLKTSAARQRFMMGFLDALYERTNPDKHEPYHVIFDEADLWAPQKPMGNEAMLCHLMEEIVRRGRTQGFIPWLISQRPAVLNKNVLSQADGLIAMSLTSSQDRDAIGAWIEGQADKADKAKVLSDLPGLGRGEGVVWIPRQQILKTVQFPENLTFDSSRTPKRGEKKRDVKIAPLNIDALQERLKTVEAETKANDPQALKAEIAKLKTELSKAPTVETINVGTMIDAVVAKGFHVHDQRALEKALREKYEEGVLSGIVAAKRSSIALVNSLLTPLAKSAEDLWHSINGAMNAFEKTQREVAVKIPEPQSGPSTAKREPAVQRPINARTSPSLNRATPSPRTDGDGTLSPALQKCLDAIAWWEKIGIAPVERSRACVVAGFSPRASTFHGYIAKLVSLGLVEVSPGKVRLTEEGARSAHFPDAATAGELRALARSLLGPQEARIFDVVYENYPNEIRRESVAEAVGLSTGASTIHGYIAGVAGYGIIEVSNPGAVRAADWLFP